jgi:hypothetical protein
VVALLKQTEPSLTQEQAKGALKAIAKETASVGWDQHYGARIIRAIAVFDNPAPTPSVSEPAAARRPNLVDFFVIGTQKAL